MSPQSSPQSAGPSRKKARHFGAHEEAPTGPARSGPRWQLVLVVFMRLMAALWMFRGLLNWTTILGVLEGPPLGALPMTQQAALVAFALLHCVIAVGLWLTGRWGGILWLILIGVEALLAWGMPGNGVTNRTIVEVSALLGLIYLALAFFAGRQEKPVTQFS